LHRVAASITPRDDAMIASFKHKALERFAESGDARRLNPDHLKRLRTILTALEAARTIEGVNVAGLPSPAQRRPRGTMGGHSASQLADHLPIRGRQSL